MTADDPIFNRPSRRRDSTRPRATMGPPIGELGPEPQGRKSIRVPILNADDLPVYGVAVSSGLALVALISAFGMVRPDLKDGHAGATGTAPVVALVTLAKGDPHAPEELCRAYGLSHVCDEALRCPGAIETALRSGTRRVRLLLRAGNETCTGIARRTTIAGD
jgi:hypothetical protein